MCHGFQVPVGDTEPARPRISRVGAIGDIHEEDDALERVLQFLEPMQLDAILAVGDIVDGPGDGARCCDLLQARGVQAVRGNHDRWFLKDELRAGGTADLPATATPTTAWSATSAA